MDDTERTRLRWVHNAMIQRCVNPNNADYPGYGGRGISVHPDWRGRGGFEPWLAELGPRPTPQHEIDRIDNDGDYEPGNVRWVTQAVQDANRRRSPRCLTLEQEQEIVTAIKRGVTRVALAESYGVHRMTITRIFNRRNA